MRILLFTGKGGVGKTTLAAATAASLAARGDKTLVVSTDPAHSLADAFGLPLGAEPSEVDSCLHAAQVDSRALVDSVWLELREQLRSALAGAGLDSLDAEELTVLPGVDELLALTEVRRLAGNGPWTTVVVDCGPTAETLRLLALPEAMERYLDRLFGKPSALGLLGRWNRTGEAVRRLGAHVASLRTMLTDPAVTTVRLVLTPERVVAAEARRTLTALALRGIGVDGLIVNRLMPAPGIWRGAAAKWLRTRRSGQDAVIADLLASGIADSGMRTVEHRAVEPVGLPELLRIADELYGGDDPLEPRGATVAPLLDVAASERGHRLTVRLALEPSAAIDLARVDDDLAVTVDGVRRLIALPELLRPCRITGADASAAGLVVHLEDARHGPDPEGEEPR
ncbi:arsenic-transporting ATPase [Amycolatopsis antarctica]|uniref:Arsenic-transporting ATPase n=1 Tax=Amycolatopsis antarctica TaxID=1854586 RepID=A0A263D893_9PSEU|nr:ArsA family ATPase [Amycolatopsis antarctica]OZM74663.1 arsenic-transporting ATPase [Amycolatopsis antarctica]